MVIVRLIACKNNLIMYEYIVSFYELSEGKDKFCNRKFAYSLLHVKFHGNYLKDTGCYNNDIKVIL